MGPEVGQLEKQLQVFCGAKLAIAVANGTDALQIALMAANIGQGHVVFVPSFTYTATAEAVLSLGARPIFVNVDPVTFKIDVKSLKAAIAKARSDGLNARGIIAVDLFGPPALWDELNGIAKENNLFLVTDAAQSFGAAEASGRKVGTLAQIMTVSFFPAKPLGCFGDGGTIFTDDDELTARMSDLFIQIKSSIWQNVWLHGVSPIM